MKRLLLILCLVLMAEGVFAQPMILNGHCQATQCYICGKTISEWIEDSYFGGYTIGDMDGFCEFEKVRYFNQANRPICDECREKYQKEYLKLVNGFYDRIKDEDSINKHDQERKEERIRKIDEQILKLQEERKRN